MHAVCSCSKSGSGVLSLCGDVLYYDVKWFVLLYSIVKICEWFQPALIDETITVVPYESFSTLHAQKCLVRLVLTKWTPLYKLGACHFRCCFVIPWQPWVGILVWGFPHSHLLHVPHLMENKQVHMNTWCFVGADGPDSIQWCCYNTYLNNQCVLEGRICVLRWASSFGCITRVMSFLVTYSWNVSTD